MKKAVLLLSALLMMSCSSDDITSKINECTTPTLSYNIKENSDLEVTNNTYEVKKGDKLVFEYISEAPKCIDKNLVERVDKRLYFEVPSNVSEFEYVGEKMELEASAIYEEKENGQQIFFDYATKGFIKGKKINGNWNVQIEVEFEDREGKIHSLKIEQSFK
ncbi:hypothetical protein KRX57_09850 [Weeksellaceae bacterium TAE3-ERU29]|nr:hypothetical protein [Weeksellaceae bacterium TAE3-ERU29]